MVLGVGQVHLVVQGDQVELAVHLQHGGLDALDVFALEMATDESKMPSQSG